MPEIKRIPFVPIPVDKALKVSKKLMFLAAPLSRTNPSLETKLFQAGIKLKAREYTSLAVFSSIFWFFLIFSIFTSLSIAVKYSQPIKLSLPFSFFVSFLSYFYIISYPNLLVIKKDKDIERNILFVVRHLYVQVKSGVPLFDALVSVSKANYGVISKELEECTKKIITGKEETAALEEMVFKNPNIHFRRTFWQIINSLRAGADIGNTLEIIAKNLSEEHKVKIRKYGSQLSPLALMYMMIAIIVPTLGINFLLIFSSFSGVSIPQTFFYLIIAVLLIFQYMFLGMIKSRRPSVEL